MLAEAVCAAVGGVWASWLGHREAAHVGRGLGLLGRPVGVVAGVLVGFAAGVNLARGHTLLVAVAVAILAAATYVIVRDY